jgi:hypothetical protein
MRTAPTRIPDDCEQATGFHTTNLVIDDQEPVSVSTLLMGCSNGQEQRRVVRRTGGCGARGIPKPAFGPAVARAYIDKHDDCDLMHQLTRPKHYPCRTHSM